MRDQHQEERLGRQTLDERVKRLRVIRVDANGHGKGDGHVELDERPVQAQASEEPQPQAPRCRSTPTSPMAPSTNTNTNGGPRRDRRLLFSDLVTPVKGRVQSYSVSRST